MNGSSLLLTHLRSGSCLASFYGKIYVVQCKVTCFDTGIQAVNLSRRGKQVLCILESLRLVLHFNFCMQAAGDPWAGE